MLHVKTATGEYPILIEHGALERAGTLFSLARKVLVLTDDGVPAGYANTIAAQCAEAHMVVVPQGEQSKSLATLERICKTMLDAAFTRSDAVVAVGGGVVGDLGGFVASVYMRGIDFYNIPTTLLSQVDSSVGGKTAVNLSGIKNCIGSFYPPRGVLIDPAVLSTLDKRQYASGMAEVIKMAATSDAALFADLEAGGKPISEIIERALRIKIAVVEADEREGGLRRILNFGHTIGHGIESLGGRYHGECVALGMLPMCAPDVRKKLMTVYQNYRLPTTFSGDIERVTAALLHDKKREGTNLHTIYVPRVGSFEIRTEAAEDFAARTKEVLT